MKSLYNYISNTKCPICNKTCSYVINDGLYDTLPIIANVITIPIFINYKKKYINLNLINNEITNLYDVDIKDFVKKFNESSIYIEKFCLDSNHKFIEFSQITISKINNKIKVNNPDFKSKIIYQQNYTICINNHENYATVYDIDGNVLTKLLCTNLNFNNLEKYLILL